MMADAQRHLDPPAPARGKGTRFWALLVLSVLLLACSALAGWVLLAPSVRAGLASQEADGLRAFGVSEYTGTGLDLGAAFRAGADTEMSTSGALAAVTPDTGWWITPQVHGGLLLHSPDRVLVVEIGVARAAEARERLDLAGAAGDPLRTETLANGARVQHVIGDTEFTAVVELGDTDLLVEAEVNPEGDLVDYRPALGALLETVTRPAG
ncbi:hypothetical protein ACR5KS_07050 [Leucobacter sp. W1153]|uniref:hypothetical protein n=1 Tax=Leucobacter sp. W1153 TaxID=3439064 RepID=UPI003F390C58